MCVVIRLTLLGLSLTFGLAQTQPDVVEILKKVGERYKSVSQYEFEINLATSENGTTSTVHQHMAFMRDKYLMQGPPPGQSGGDGMILHDGSTVWFYLRELNQYGSVPASALTAGAPGDLADLRPEAMDYFITWRWRGAADFSKGARLLREEIIEFGGSKVSTYVLNVIADKQGRSKPVYTWWVDKTNYRILREDGDSGSAVFTSIRLNEPIPDELFKFVPPAGARKTETQQ